MPLTTDGLIEELERFRSDKLALVALVGSMGAESEVDALERLREIKDLMAAQLIAMRRKGRGRTTHSEMQQKRIVQGVYDLCCEIEPWLEQIFTPKAVAAGA